MQSPQVKDSVNHSTPVAVTLYLGGGPLLLFSASAGQTGRNISDTLGKSGEKEAKKN